MLDYILKNGAISKRNGKGYKDAETEYISGSLNYTAVRFILDGGEVHPTVLYMPSRSISRVCSMCVKVKQKLGV